MTSRQRIISGGLSSLTTRLLILLTLTMAPIGAIAVYQTSRLSDALVKQATEGLLTSTVDAVTNEIAAAEGVFGGASAISLYARYRWDEGIACEDTFQTFIARHPGYRFAGVLTDTGVTCAGPDSRLLISGLDLPASAFDLPKAFIVSDTDGDAEEDRTIIGHPVFWEGELSHYVLLQMSGSRFSVDSVGSNRRPEAIVTFAAGGVLLSSSVPKEVVEAELPRNLPLSDLAQKSGTVFSAVNGDGERRHFSVVPVHGNQIYALASWSPSVARVPAVGSRLQPWIFPIAMWVATLGITYIALSRLVVRHVRRLGLRMRRFAQSRNISEIGLPSQIEPQEFRDINESFRAMAEVILRDEAELENALHEKTLLIREVHHRVKNNLQLIASIMSMQIRKSRNSETGAVVGRLQDRVLGLAAIHRQMYAATTLERVPADTLVDAILTQTMRIEDEDGIDITRDLRSLSLVPDQAVPLALLTAEAMTNAVHHLGARDGVRAFIHISLEKLDDDTIRLEVRNSIRPDAQPMSEGLVPFRQQGLGAQLIDAFTRQLGGKLEVDTTDDVYTLRVSFPRARFDNDDEDEAAADEAAREEKSAGSGAA